MEGDSNHLPTVDTSFIVKALNASPRIESHVTTGSIKSFLLKGTSKSITRRIITVDTNSSEVSYECATGIAIKSRTIPQLNSWLLENRKWKEGAYIA